MPDTTDGPAMKAYLAHRAYRKQVEDGFGSRDNWSLIDAALAELQAERDAEHEARVVAEAKVASEVERADEFHRHWGECAERAKKAEWMRDTAAHVAASALPSAILQCIRSGSNGYEATPEQDAEFLTDIAARYAGVLSTHEDEKP